MAKTPKSTAICMGKRRFLAVDLVVFRGKKNLGVFRLKKNLGVFQKSPYKSWLFSRKTPKSTAKRRFFPYKMAFDLVVFRGKKNLGVFRGKKNLEKNDRVFFEAKND